MQEQYVYLHEALSDALLFGTHSVKTGQFEQVYSYLLQTEEGTSKTNLEMQFEVRFYDVFFTTGMSLFRVYIYIFLKTVSWCPAVLTMIRVIYCLPK